MKYTIFRLARFFIFFIVVYFILNHSPIKVWPLSIQIILFLITPLILALISKLFYLNNSEKITVYYSCKNPKKIIESRYIKETPRFSIKNFAIFFKGVYVTTIDPRKLNNFDLMSIGLGSKGPLYLYKFEVPKNRMLIPPQGFVWEYNVRLIKGPINLQDNNINLEGPIKYR